MSREERFDSFYESTRRAALLRTLALSGDLPAAEAAVHESYARAWQHWRRVSALDDPLGWVARRSREVAERRTGRPADVDPASKARPAPEALSDLPIEDRRRLADQVTPESVPRPLAPLEDLTADVSFPEASVVRAAGRRRRRTWLGVTAAAVALALVLGALTWAAVTGPDPAAAVRTPAASPTPTPSARLPVADDLLDRTQVAPLGGSRGWRVERTDANVSGDGINSLCQRHRFADPRGLAAIVRTFRAAGKPRRSAVQTVEVSRSVPAARQAYRTTVGWYAGCRVARLQVLDAYRVDRVGDQAQVMTLRLSDRPTTMLSVAVARTGAVVTSTVGTTVGAGPPHVGQVIRTLEEAVKSLCVRAVGGGCVRTPTYRAVPPPPAGRGEEPGVLAVADLPPIGRLDDPWVGTRPAPTRSYPSVTACDRADFRGAGAVRTRTRTYLIPQARLPARFGLSQTYGTFRSAKAAKGFLAARRADLAGCDTRDEATEVGAERRTTRSSPQVDLSQWLLTTTVSPEQRVLFRIGFVRVGRSVAQLTFAPTPGTDMGEARFGSLLVRAGDRLRELS